MATGLDTISFSILLTCHWDNSYKCLFPCRTHHYHHTYNLDTIHLRHMDNAYKTHHQSIRHLYIHSSDRCQSYQMGIARIHLQVCNILYSGKKIKMWNNKCNWYEMIRILYVRTCTVVTDAVWYFARAVRWTCLAFT